MLYKSYVIVCASETNSLLQIDTPGYCQVVNSYSVFHGRAGQPVIKYIAMHSVTGTGVCI